MKYSQETRKFALDLVLSYYNYDRVYKSYTLNLSTIPQAELTKLSAMIIKDNKDLGSESTGPDNDYYFSSMLPSLIDYLFNQNKVNQKEFLSSWKEGVINYLKNPIEKMLSDILDELNSTRKEDAYMDDYAWGM